MKLNKYRIGLWLNVSAVTHFIKIAMRRISLCVPPLITHYYSSSEIWNIVVDEMQPLIWESMNSVISMMFLFIASVRFLTWGPGHKTTSIWKVYLYSMCVMFVTCMLIFSNTKTRHEPMRRRCSPYNVSIRHNHWRQTAIAICHFI